MRHQLRRLPENPPMNKERDWAAVGKEIINHKVGSRASTPRCRSLLRYWTHEVCGLRARTAWWGDPLKLAIAARGGA